MLIDSDGGDGERAGRAASGGAAARREREHGLTLVPGRAGISAGRGGTRADFVGAFTLNVERRRARSAGGVSAWARDDTVADGQQFVIGQLIAG